MDQEMKKLRMVSMWFFISAAMVFAMVVIGAITRLTESGLSMVEWRPLIGAMPPMGEAEWARVFDLYRETPEFQKKNSWMEITDFKTIFFWEWFHRFWGRMIGLVYALPMIWFWARGMLPCWAKWPAVGLLLLGGAQGALGWYMVKSGLVDQPAVSHYRLAAHLGLAFTLFSLLVWMGRRVWPAHNCHPVGERSELSNGIHMCPLKADSLPDPRRLSASRRGDDRPLIIHLWAVIVCVAVTVFWGAYVAGLDAGLIYNDSFPMMGGRWVPEEITGGIDLLESHAGVQFMHRWLAMFTVAMVLGFWVHAWRRGVRAMEVNAMAAMVVAQMILGIVTLLSGVSLWIAVAHQAGALILVGLCVLSLYRVWFRSP